MFPRVQSVTDELLEEIDRNMFHNPQGFRVDELIERYSVKVITQATLGYHSNAFSDKDDVTLRYMHAAHESASAENFATGLARLFPLLTSVLKPLDRKHKLWAGSLSRSAQCFVNLVKRDPQAACPVMRSLVAHSEITPEVSVSTSHTDSTSLPDKQSSHPPNPALIYTDQEKTEGVRLSEQDIVDQVMGLLNAGLGPLAVAMTFVLYCLATERQEQERVVEEIETITTSEDCVTLDELKRMKVLERFIMESMRMFPVAPGVSRECVKDCVLSGRTFTKGMVIRVMSGVMYKQEENFAQSRQFNPDRFPSSWLYGRSWYHEMACTSSLCRERHLQTGSEKR
ncbi:cytochrome p450 [Elysia marginata]|uniref:Cytochrome p450 n=1 Tax=Elysia marginata TaxID=1093978 RepID=A0AAV4EJI6_9GAST|nr:cytochrome p450 [Elysia marginata]